MTKNATNAQYGTQKQYTRQETSTYYAQHDFDGPAKLSSTLIHAIAEVANADMTDTESTLFQHVDPDALNELFAPPGRDASATNGHLRLDIWGYDVTIYANGQIIIAPPPHPGR
jgi:hypothetical protein